MDGHGRLVVVGGGEHLALLGRNGGVLGDELGHHATQRLDAERQGGDVEQQHVLDFTLQHAGLDRGADGHRLIRVHVLARLLAEKGLHRVLYLRHARHAADEDHVLDIRDLDAGILDGDAAGFDGAGDKILHQAFELGAGDLHGQVLRARGIRRDVRQIDLGLLRTGQLDLGFFRRFLQSLQGQHVVLEVDALILLELGHDVVDQALVEVLAAEEGVAVGR